MRPSVVIVGAGFGGIAAAGALKRADADILLIDRTNHHLFQPLLYQVATAALSPADIATASRVLLRGQDNAAVIMAEVTGIDTQAKAVLLADGRHVAFDYLVLAIGAAYSFFGHDEWAEHAQVLKSLDDALLIRERLLFAFERAEQCGNPAEVKRLLTFVIVGGGPTGVELAGTIAELARSTLARDFRHIDPQSARIILCEAGPQVLGVFPKDLSAYAQKALASLGVDVRLGQAVSQVDADGIILGDERISAQTVIWCAGTQARPAAQWLGIESARNGAVKVLPDCSVPSHPHIFAIGDVASFDPGTGRPLPGLAPVAKQQGKYVGRLLAAKIAGGGPTPPFRYCDLGSMAVIGRSRAIVSASEPMARSLVRSLPAMI